MKRIVVAFSTAALLLVGCDTGISANAGVCGAVVQMTASVGTALNAAAQGNEARVEESLEEIIEEANNAADSSTGPAADAARELAEVAERIKESGEMTGDDAKEALSSALRNFANLCR